LTYLFEILGQKYNGAYGENLKILETVNSRSVQDIES